MIPVTTNQASGLPCSAHTSTRNSRLHDHYLPRINDQYWFYCRAQRHRIPSCCGTYEFLLHHDRLSSMETSEGRTVTIKKVVAGQIWSSNQHCLDHVPYTNLLFCLLAPDNPGPAKLDELGSGHVRRNSHLVPGLLCYLGATLLCWSGHNGEERMMSMADSKRYNYIAIAWS